MTDDLIGKKFNMLTVLAFDHKDKYHNKFYKCKCECGRERVVSMSRLTNGKTKSCGCIRKGTGIKDLTG